MRLIDQLVTVFDSRLRQLEARVRTELFCAALDGTPAATSVYTSGHYVLTDVDAAVALGLLASAPSGDVERTIAELAAAGQSNNQIAAHLYPSPRTVGTHLYPSVEGSCLGVSDTAPAATGHMSSTS